MILLAAPLQLISSKSKIEHVLMWDSDKKVPFTFLFRGSREQALQFTEYSWTDDPFTSPPDTTRPRLCAGSIVAQTPRGKIVIDASNDKGLYILSQSGVDILPAVRHTTTIEGLRWAGNAYEREWTSDDPQIIETLQKSCSRHRNINLFFGRIPTLIDIIIFHDQRLPINKNRIPFDVIYMWKRNDQLQSGYIPDIDWNTCEKLYEPLLSYSDIMEKTKRLDPSYIDISGIVFSNRLFDVLGGQHLMLRPISAIPSTVEHMFTLKPAVEMIVSSGISIASPEGQNLLYDKLLRALKEMHAGIPSYIGIQIEPGTEKLLFALINTAEKHQPRN